jgi:ABC-2 type transport system ATP-binding protein
VNAIETRALRKVYPTPLSRRLTPNFGVAAADRVLPPEHDARGEVVALDGLDLDVEAGEFFGLLGPNGAGKTTTLGILTTRVRPTSGEARVCGADVTLDDAIVKQRIGVVPQRPNPDRGLDVLENLLFHAAYFGIPRSESLRRARKLLERLGIADKAEAMVDTLSGGQQQRLMIARALIHEPSVIFLDEPTVGLDPQARIALWEVLRDLHARGRTIVLTTHYMEEADRLCGRIAIVDKGRLLAVDTPDVLKARAPGGTLLEVTLDGDGALVAARARDILGLTRVEASNGTVRAYAERGGELLPALIRAAEESGRTVKNIHLAPPSLETLFLSLTGRRLQ